MPASPSVVVRDGAETLALYNVKIDEDLLLKIICRNRYFNLVVFNLNSMVLEKGTLLFLFLTT